MHNGRQNKYRWVEIVVGLLLLSIGLLGLFALFYLTRGGGSLMIIEPELWNSKFRVIRRAAYVLVLSGFVFFGTNFIAGKKPTILFLRRFGLDVNMVISRIVRSGFGRRFRIVTLDDGSFPPVDTPPLERWTSRLAAPFAAVALLVWLSFVFPEVRRSADHGASLSSETMLMARFWLTLAIVFIAIVLVHLWRIQRNSHLYISNRCNMKLVMSMIVNMRLFIRRLTMLAPQSTVISVVDDLWQEAVLGASEQTQLTLVDISVPTINLQWEIERLRSSSSPYIFIAEQTHWESMFLLTGEEGRCGIAIRSLVGENRVLLYDGNDLVGGKHFRKNLSAALNKELSQVSVKRRFPNVGNWWYGWREFTFYTITGFAALYIGLRAAASLALQVNYHYSFYSSGQIMFLMSFCLGVNWFLCHKITKRIMMRMFGSDLRKSWQFTVPWRLVSVITVFTLFYFALIFSVYNFKFLIISSWVFVPLGRGDK